MSAVPRPAITWSQSGDKIEIMVDATPFEIEWSPETLRRWNGYGPETTIEGKEWRVRAAHEDPVYRYPGMPTNLMVVEVADSFTPEQALKLADEIRDAARKIQEERK